MMSLNAAIKQIRFPGRTLFSVWMGICLAAPASEVASNYHVFNWQIEDGLPQNSIQKIAQTADGYLWLATFQGLARFDGRRFKVFNTLEIPNLRGKPITCLYGDAEGRLWIGTPERLICYSQGEFTSYPAPAGPKLGEISAIAEVPSGTLYALSRLGLCRIDTHSARLIAVPNPLGPNGGSAMVTDSTDRVWVANGNTLYCFDQGRWSVRAEFTSIIFSLFVESNGTVLCGLNGGTVAQHQERNPPRYFQLGAETILGFVHSDHSGTLVRMGRNLCEFPKGEIIQIALPNRMPANRILDSYRDREGNLWAGTDGDGLVLLHWKPLMTYSVEQGIGHRHITTVAEDHRRQIWLGTMGGTVNTLQNGQWQLFEPPVPRPIGALRETRDHQLWIATFGGHLWRVRDGARELEVQSRALAGRALFEDSRGRLWIGGDGMGAECLSAGRIVRYDTGNGLRSDRTRCFAEDKSGSIWVGTDQGLYRISDERAQGFFVSDGLGSDVVQALCVDTEGSLWIGTGGGLTRYRGGQFATINSRNGLLDDMVSQILEDDFEHLWLGSNRGLFRASRVEFDQALNTLAPRVPGRVFGRADGMRNLECTGGFQPNCMKSSDGRLWFATIDGLIVIDPKNLPVNQVPPPVHIERFVADGIDLISDSGPIRSEDLGPKMGTRREPTDPLKRSKTVLPIPAGTRRLEIHYTGISFSAINGLRFKYKLENYDPRWNESDSLRVASYTHMPPGDYLFRVQAAHGDGPWNPQWAEVAFRIPPEFWQTWWFQGTSVLAVAGLVFAYSYGPIQRRRQMERLRLRIARDLHDEVGSNLGTIALYNQLAKSKTPSDHASAREFQEIDRVVERTAQSLRDVIWFINPEFDTLGGMLQHMEDAANRTLAGKTVVFEADSPQRARPLAVEFRRNMFFTFRELIHNILKHSQAKRVHITVSEEQKMLRLHITDDGVGFDPRTGRKGNGLKNMRQRTAEIGGTFQVDSQPGRGVTIRLTVPLT